MELPMSLAVLGRSNYASLASARREEEYNNEDGVRKGLHREDHRWNGTDV